MAAVSKNSHEGLSRARDPRNLELCAEAESKWENAENDTFYLVNDVIWESAMNGAPLIKRGWVLQERILSPRSLHFCENELFWECREKIACETYPTGIPSICSNNSQSNIKIREPSESESYEKTHLVHGTSKAKKDVAYDRWATWVVLYSRAYLTKDSDKLVAISTLAKFTRTALDDVYVAGLWRSKFVDQLVWSSFHRKFTTN
ncbi:hypothetical protein DID88_006611 [Monilinia fructigena]|uniref:Heterokaryon incompatibility domain-containing protein n=1 Tax=Monilinia fructigena TaxID=38457 RepID=A0A395IJ64_9HELO|nr:hypothetical protein DID88_006611 [Monilinia fructigena]